MHRTWGKRENERTEVNATCHIPLRLNDFTENSIDVQNIIRFFLNHCDKQNNIPEVFHRIDDDPKI